MTTQEIEGIITGISDAKMKILDDFCKAYLASNIEYFLENPRRIKKLCLDIRQTENGFTYSFRIKPGPNSTK